MYRLEYVDTSIFIQKKKEDKNVIFGGTVIILINYYKETYVINHLIIIDYQNAAMEISPTIVTVVQSILDNLN